jgi:hypothetical protein
MGFGGVAKPDGGGLTRRWLPGVDRRAGDLAEAPFQDESHGGRGGSGRDRAQVHGADQQQPAGVRPGERGGAQGVLHEEGTPSDPALLGRGEVERADVALGGHASSGASVNSALAFFARAGWSVVVSSTLA